LEQTISYPPTDEVGNFGSKPDEYPAFDPMAGPCSAAHAEWLRRLRDSKQYKNHGSDWDTFCREHLRLTGGQATEIIATLEEFGPAYFVLAGLTPITPEEFRTLAPRIKGRFFCANGQVVALLPRNARKVAAMVEKLRRPEPTPKRAGRAPVSGDAVTLLEFHCREAIQEFRRLGKPQTPDVDRLRLASVLRKTLSILGRIEMDLGIY
jgi:hypothetical protein